jgi:hypothetical protein
MLGYLSLGSRFSQGMGGQARVHAMAVASGLYHRARSRARWGRLRSAMTGRTRSLLELTTVKESCAVRGQCYGGTRTVSLSQIRGSEGRWKDFDCDFRPLQEHTRGRWIGIAAAREMGTPLPPVELVQVGDVYFVRDGHHRISVARTVGQRDIEAEVTVWHVDGPLPWEEPLATESPQSAGKLAGQPA